MGKVGKILRANLAFIICLAVIITTLVVWYPLIVDKVTGGIYSVTYVDPWSQTGNWTAQNWTTSQNTTEPPPVYWPWQR